MIKVSKVLPKLFLLLVILLLVSIALTSFCTKIMQWFYKSFYKELTVEWNKIELDITTSHKMMLFNIFLGVIFFVSILIALAINASVKQLIAMKKNS